MGTPDMQMQLRDHLALPAYRSFCASQAGRSSFRSFERPRLDSIVGVGVGVGGFGGHCADTSSDGDKSRRPIFVTYPSMPTPDPSATEASDSAPRTGQACDRCKRRKIRCDNTPGGCFPCRQAHARCATTDRNSGRARARGHVEELERELHASRRRVLDLEQQLCDLGVVPVTRAAAERSDGSPHVSGHGDAGTWSSTSPPRAPPALTSAAPNLEGATLPEAVHESATFPHSVPGLDDAVHLQTPSDYDHPASQTTWLQYDQPTAGHVPVGAGVLSIDPQHVVGTEQRHLPPLPLPLSFYVSHSSSRNVHAAAVRRPAVEQWPRSNDAEGHG